MPLLRGIFNEPISQLLEVCDFAKSSLSVPNVKCLCTYEPKLVEQFGAYARKSAKKKIKYSLNQILFTIFEILIYALSVFWVFEIKKFLFYSFYASNFFYTKTLVFLFFQHIDNILLRSQISFSIFLLNWVFQFLFNFPNQTEYVWGVFFIFSKFEIVVFSKNCYVPFRNSNLKIYFNCDHFCKVLGVWKMPNGLKYAHFEDFIQNLESVTQISFAWQFISKRSRTHFKRLELWHLIFDVV